MGLGIGYLRLESRRNSLNAFAGHVRQSAIFKRPLEALLVISVPVYVLLNIAIIVISPIAPRKSPGDTTNAFPGYAYPAVVASLVAVGTLYYLLFFGAVCRSYKVISFDDERQDEGSPSRGFQKGILKPTSPFNLMRYACVVCEIQKDDFYNRNVERVFRFGRRWRMRYYLTGYDLQVSSLTFLKDINLTPKQNFNPATSNGTSGSPISERARAHFCHGPLLDFWWVKIEGTVDSLG